MNITEFQHTFYVTTQQPWCEEKKCFVQNSKLWLFDFFFLFLGSGSTFIGLEQICYEAH